jgi:hypothetical protein
LEDVPEEVRKELSFIFVDTVEEAIEAALEKGVKARKSVAKRKPRKAAASKSRGKKSRQKKNASDSKKS